MLHRLKQFQFWILLLACLVLSLTPQPPDVFSMASDKVWHLLAYLVLYLSCQAAYPARIRSWLCFVLLLGFSFGIEVAQHFVPNREFSLLDLLTNAAGLAIGMVTVAGCARAKLRP